MLYIYTCGTSVLMYETIKFSIKTNVFKRCRLLTKAKVWHGLPIVRITKLVLGENKLYKTYICYLPAGRSVLKNIFERSASETEGKYFSSTG
jgi:hypothetical protein